MPAMEWGGMSMSNSEASGDMYARNDPNALSSSRGGSSVPSGSCCASKALYCSASSCCACASSALSSKSSAARALCERACLRPRMSWTACSFCCMVAVGHIVTGWPHCVHAAHLNLASLHSSRQAGVVSGMVLIQADHASSREELLELPGCGVL